ncbi:ribonuclease HI family protein [Candidatus Woesebacteria bacterium]|nr:ribonuclease HI family protein [Candidatus Woesebacteria bacterium]
MKTGSDKQVILSIYTDGGSRGNPGKAATGFVFYLDGEEKKRAGHYIGIQTNNVAEYQAFLSSLIEFLDHKDEFSISEICWFLDSKLVVEQLNNRWRVKEVGLLSLWKECKKLLSTLAAPYTISYIPRENNAVADGVVNQTLDEMT